MRFAFYGRVSTEDQQDPESSKQWQSPRSLGLIEPPAARSSRSSSTSGRAGRCRGSAGPRPRGCSAAIARPDRGFDAVVIGEPQRAFYGNQFGLTFPVFAHYGVELWVPEVGGADRPRLRGARPRDDRSSAGCRRASGRGSRPASARPWPPRRRSRAGSSAGGRRTATGSPTPARTRTRRKAADGKRLHRLEPDPVDGAGRAADLRRVPRRPRAATRSPSG